MKIITLVFAVLLSVCVPTWLIVEVAHATDAGPESVKTQSHDNHPQATFVVNVSTDQPDSFIGDGICDVDPITPGNQCTLRAAIQEANASVSSDNISFSIPGNGLHLIQLSNNLPIITSQVVIDGYTQPGSVANTLPVGNNAILNIEVRQTVFNANLFVISSGNSSIRGLVLNATSDGQSSAALLNFTTNGGNRVEGCWFGINPDGTVSSLHTTFGVRLNSSDNVVGGSSAGSRNIITNLTQGGIVDSDAGGLTVQNNYFGTNPSGSEALGTLPVAINCGDNALIGGSDVAMRNVVVADPRGGRNNRR